MLYAQFEGGLKLHLVYEPGEGHGDQIVRKGYLSAPLCGIKRYGAYRMTCNMPLGHACQNCQKVAAALRVNP